MKYALLIYGDEKDGFNATNGQQDARQAEARANFEALVKSGVLVAGNRLSPTSAATTLRVHNGERVITHGPFAETQEQLGGIVVVEADNLDEALELAARTAGPTASAIEVRPIMDLGRQA
jgi:hypothetical protein